MRATRVDRARNEEGFFLVMFALLLVAMLITVALVLEFGQVRDDRQSNKSSADFAALAGVQNIDNGEGAPQPWKGVCAAIQWLEANNARFEGLNGSYTDGNGGALPVSNPCTELGAVWETTCAANDPATWAWFRGTSADGRLTVDIKSGYQMPDPDFSSDAAHFASDSGLEGMCDNFAVIVQQARPRGFSRVAGGEDLYSRIRSVARFDIDMLRPKVAALNLLERTDCGALQTSGGGESGSGVVVQHSAIDNPGIINSDSAGVVNGDNCTTNENPGGYVIYGTALPAAGGGGPSITAETSPDGTLGRIQAYSYQVGGRGAAVYPGGLSVEPTEGPIVSRTPGDERYNPSDRPAITDLHTNARAATIATTAPAGFTTISGGQCNGLFDTVVSADGIWVDCPVFSPSTAVLDAPTVIFTGKVTVDNNQLLSIPAAQQVFIRGCNPAETNCNGGNYYALNVAGTLRINTATTTGPAPSCAARAGPGAGGSVTNTTVVATFNGPYLVPAGGVVSMCQTTVYIGKDDASYSQQSVTSGGLNCSVELPCPKETDAGGGYIEILGNADWSAPNQLDTPADDVNPFEDLALWSESHEDSAIKGQGGSRTEGVYFTPNSSVTFTGQATQTQPLNAQFFSRKLNISGQGNLFLKPNPKDSIESPVIGGFTLVR